MSNLDESVKEISGPINVVRLEGEINNIKKVIYLFMDMHQDLYDQSECDNIFAKEIPQYLADNFLKMNDSNITYDFFLETITFQLENVNYGVPFRMDINFKDIYILRLRKFFNKIFNYNPETNKVSMSKIFKNIRLHYMDVREYMFRNFDIKFNEIKYAIGNMQHNQNIQLVQLTQIINNLNDIKNNTMILLDNTLSLEGQAGVKSGISAPAKINKSKIIKYASDNLDKQENYVDNMKYLINKISELYNHKSVQDKMLIEVDIMIKNFKDIVPLCDEIINVVNNIGNVINAHPKYKLTEQYPNYGLNYDYGINDITISELILTLKKHTSYLDIKVSDAFLLFMDIYFLRRFLDKDYITNAIVYTGAYHSLQYIEILTKDFDFKITHTSYSLIPDMDKLNEEVLKREVATLSEIFFPPTLSQCSDVTNFPDLFL